MKEFQAPTKNVFQSYSSLINHQRLFLTFLSRNLQKIERRTIERSNDRTNDRTTNKGHALAASRFGAKPPAPQYYKVATTSRLRDNLWKLALRGHLNTDVRARGSNSQPLDPEFDALDRSATDPQLTGYIPGDLQARHVKYVLNQIKSNQTSSLMLVEAMSDRKRKF